MHKSSIRTSIRTSNRYSNNFRYKKVLLMKMFVLQILLNFFDTKQSTEQCQSTGSRAVRTVY